MRRLEEQEVHAGSALRWGCATHEADPRPGGHGGIDVGGACNPILQHPARLTEYRGRESVGDVPRELLLRRSSIMRRLSSTLVLTQGAPPGAPLVVSDPRGLSADCLTRAGEVR